MQMTLDPTSMNDYARFLKIKGLPKYSLCGRTATFPDEYAKQLGIRTRQRKQTLYDPHAALFDYQRDIARLAIHKGKFAVFADCGLGKTLIFLEFARHVSHCLNSDQVVMIVSPLMVIPQTLRETTRFYGPSLHVEQIRAADLRKRLLSSEGGIIITNYEAITDDIQQGNLGAIVLDESSMLKSHYGKWAVRLLALGSGLDWKLCCTGTPAPNDRIEYANHAVFLDAFPTVNSFLARYFVNRGQTAERWQLKQHALGPFYRSLSHWCIFLTNPGTYGWSDGCTPLPPIHVKIHDVPMTAEQQGLTFELSGTLFANELGGIASRSSYGQIAKGWHKGKRVPTHKPEFIRDLIATWPDESTLVWCIYNQEQAILEETIPNAVSIKGSTPEDDRQRMILDFQEGRAKVLISKPKILGFGLNLQVATRQVFSGLQDSYESYYQAVKRSNRYGAHRPLNVHIPITDIERPMVDNVLCKAHRVHQDTIEQEEIFKRASNIAVK